MENVFYTFLNKPHSNFDKLILEIVMEVIMILVIIIKIMLYLFLMMIILKLKKYRKNNQSL